MDINFTNLLYIINPEKDSWPQLEHILAAHTSVIFIDSRLWSEYLSKLEAMLTDGSIGINDYALLVSNNKAVLEYLAETNPDSVRQDDICEVLDNIRVERKELEEEYAQSRSDREAMKYELEKKESEIRHLRTTLQENTLKAQQQEYEKQMQRIIEPDVKKTIRKRLIDLFCYLSFIAAAVIVFSINQSLPNGICSIILFIVPFVAAFIKHENLFQSMRILFSKKNRIQFQQIVRDKLKDKYVHDHPVKQLNNNA